MKNKPNSTTSTYAEYWDAYVERFPKLKASLGDNDNIAWPGDEWGTPDRWRVLFSQLFLSKIDTPPKTAIEIGSGAGKYTLMFMESFQTARLIAADVSSAFLDTLQERCAELISSGRLNTALIDNDHNALINIANKFGIAAGELDVLFSIDAMVHVDLQYLVAYWISAQELLRPGGKMIMTVADATRDGGFAKLNKDVSRLFSLQGQQTDKFEWLCPQLVESVLGRLGFDVEGVEPPWPCRDYWFVATKKSLDSDTLSLAPRRE